MKLQILGTGSADGWPNPMCACESCTTLRARGEFRRHTSVLVDDVILFDLGPDVARSAESHGAFLGQVEHVVLSHAHPDHLDPAVMLWRSWVTTPSPLSVHGPDVALDVLRPWLPPDDVETSTSNPTLHGIAAGDTRTLKTAQGSYELTAIASTHIGPADLQAGDDRVDVQVEVQVDIHCATALIYALVGPDGTRMLYATDTGLLSTDALAHAMPTNSSVAGFDVVFLDETFGTHTTHNTGHHDLTTFATQVQEWRAQGVVSSTTDVIAVHMSHHNPPDVSAALQRIGARTVRDGQVVHSNGRGHIHLLIGGARSGKSRIAEQIAAGYNDVTYVATAVPSTHQSAAVKPDEMKPDEMTPPDIEWAARVAAHQARRPAHWATVETLDVESVLASAPLGAVVLIDCATLWLTGVLDALDAWASEPIKQEVLDALHTRVRRLCDALQRCAAAVVIVSNEVGQGVVPATSSGRLFRDEMGRLNIALSQIADRADFIVAGRRLPLATITQRQDAQA